MMQYSDPFSYPVHGHHHHVPPRQGLWHPPQHHHPSDFMQLGEVSVPQWRAARRQTHAAAPSTPSRPTPTPTTASSPRPALFGFMKSPSKTPPKPATKGCGCQRNTFDGHSCVEVCREVGCDGSCGHPATPARRTPPREATPKPWVPPSQRVSLVPSYSFSEFAEANNQVLQKLAEYTDIVPVSSFLSSCSHEWDGSPAPSPSPSPSPSPARGSVFSAGKALTGAAKVKRQIRSILNKLTPENYDQLAPLMGEQVVEAIREEQTDENFLDEIIDLVHEVAVRDKRYAPTFARVCDAVCQKEVEATSNSVEASKFRRSLINKCQKEFLAMAREKPTPPPEDEDEDEEQFREMEEQKKRKRATANIHFVGELFKLSLLAEQIMHEIVRTMLSLEDTESLPEEAHIEVTVQLLTTVGAQLELTFLEKCFRKLHWLEGQCSKRVGYLIKDVIELREGQWASKRGQDAPRTLREIEAEEREKAMRWS